MSRVSTSAGRAPDFLRSMATLRSTTSVVTSVPLAIRVVSSSNSSPMTAASLADPVTVISLPRTWMSESNSSSITASSSSRDPSRLTIEWGSGITIRSDVAPPYCCPAGPVSVGFFFNTPASSWVPHPGGHAIGRPPSTCACACSTVCPALLPVLKTTR
jgi:hypothetical protein